LGTGRFIQRQTPSWIWSWLKWILGQLLESPGEQQTEITRRQYPEMPFYRIDTQLEEDIPLDDIGSIDKLRQYGERLAERTDWEAILASQALPYRIGKENTQWKQYKQPAS